MNPIERLMELVGRFPPDLPASLLAGVIIRVECA